VCGIAGVYEYATAEGRVDPSVVVAMGEAVRHRGPDGTGHFVSPDRRIGLANRRLAIVDPGHGEQPMFGPRGECVVFNGEIYNYPRLRSELEDRGVSFATRCDTEVLLHLYRLEGEAFLERLDGMFGFAIWDRERERLLMARDPIGEKPLYWTEAGGRLVFGSEIKALLKHPAVAPAVNEAAIAPYLANLVSPGPETLFQGIFKLAPGTAATCDRRGVRIHRFSDLYDERGWSSDGIAQAATNVREILDRSIRDRMMSDVDVGALLSGGLDSTTLVAMLGERAQGMPTFSVGFEGRPEIDEREEARRVADELGTEHHEVSVSESDAIGFLPRLVHHQDEPLADPVCVPLHFVCELARENGVKVVLAGEGADELFWGYPHYRQGMRTLPLLRALLALPRGVRARLPTLPGVASRPRGQELLQGVAAGRLRPLHFPPGLTAAERGAVLASHSTWDLELDSAAAPGSARDQLVRDTQRYEFETRLPELLLMRIDRFSMASGVEARVPFLAPELVRYVNDLSLDRKLRRGIGKRVLKQAVAGLVPERVLSRPKQGFGAPVFEWMGSRTGALLAELLEDPAIGGYFDGRELERLLATENAAASAFLTWPILNFALWHRHWIQGEDLGPVVERLRGSAR
jgi:asparagine synthase (glutamine-hydrolysing)